MFLWRSFDRSPNKNLDLSNISVEDCRAQGYSSPRFLFVILALCMGVHLKHSISEES